MGLHLIPFALTPAWLQVSLNVFLVVMGLNLVILVHEWGHFIVARMCGVKCEKFYIWFDIFGWKFFKFKWGDTEYGLGVLPLGGYVKMLGQEDNPARLKEEIERAKQQAPEASESLQHEIESAEEALYDPRSYLAKSVPKRMAIISAGVIMNVVFAFVAAVCAYGLGVQHISCAVGSVFSGEAAWQANFQAGYVMEEIEGKPTARFSDLQRAISLGDIDNGVTIGLLRWHEDGTNDRIEAVLQPNRFRNAPTIGVSSSYSTTLRSSSPVWPATPAAEAQPPLESGDRIVRIFDTPITHFGQIHAAQARFRSEPIEITVKRELPRPADADPDAPAETEELTIRIDPAPMRHLGLAMQMGPVHAVQNDSPAARAGIEKDDQIEAVDGKPARELNPMTLPNRLRELALEKSEVVISIRKKGEKEARNVTVPLRVADWYSVPVEESSPADVPALGLAYRVLNKVQQVEEGGPAAKAGIQPGNVIVAAKLIPPGEEALKKLGLAEATEKVRQREFSIEFDNPEANWPVFSWLLQDALPGTRVELKIRSEGTDDRLVMLTPVESADWFHPGRGLMFDNLGFLQTARSLPEAFQLGWRETSDSLGLIFRTLTKLSTGQVSHKALVGPIGIVEIAMSFASQGLSPLLIFLCLISANLAVLNFIPIPVLDGGHMVFLAYEGIFGKAPNERVLTVLLFVGLFLLLGLMLLVTGNDITRLLGW